MIIQRLLAKAAMLMLLCVFFTQTSFSQTKTLTGKVSDDKGAPVQGATVTAKGSKGGVTTGADGTFRINVSPTASTLSVSSIGFTQQDIPIGDQTSINVSLVASTSNLNEVVVIGYGTVRRKDLTGSVTTVTPKEFNRGVITSPDQLLQNKVSGLEIVNNSGQPGSATTVKIRGNSSIRGAGNPLYVIDGVPLDGRNARPAVTLGVGGFGPTPDENPLLFINPNDISDITVLKDASSTAIYGSRGANGVIVITTKKGSAGPTKLELGTSLGMNVGYMKKYDILNAGEFRSALHKYQLDTLTNKLDFGHTSDAMKEITQHTAIQTYSMAMSGGSETGKFRASFLAQKTPGFIKTNDLDKYIGSFSGSYKFLDKRLSLDFGLIAGHTTEHIVLVSNSAGSQGNLISSALQWNPTQNFTDASGNYIYPANGSGNPLALLRAYNDVAYVNTVLGNISASYKILPGLEYKMLYSINQSNGTRNTNLDGFLNGITGISGVGLGLASNAALTSQIFTHTVNFHTNLSQDLTFDALGGFEYWKSNYGNGSVGATGFNTNLTQATLQSIQYTAMLQDGKTQFLPSTFVDLTTELQSYFARVNFNLRDKYYLTATIRDDGSSKFGANNKYGVFPSVGAKWNIGNEDFMKDGKTLSGLALRGTWGITGSSEFPSGASQEQFVFNSYNNAGQTNVANPNLKWEQTTQFDFGLDFSLLNNRITGTVDYYNKNTTNILFQSTAIQPAPASSYWINLPGHLINSGVEITLGGALVRQKDFTWDMTVNMAFNHNILKEFYAPGSKTPLVIKTSTIDGQGVSGTLSQVITNNQPIDEFFLKPFQGFDQNGAQKVGPDPAYAGDPNPHFLYGVSTTLQYKKLSLVLNGGGAGGYLIYNNTATDVTNLSSIAGGRNVDKRAYNSAERVSSGAAASTRFLESGNYFKLRNATVNFSVGNVGDFIKNLNVYFSGSNLFVATKFSGFDPEVNIDKNSNGYPSRSIEYIPYPTPRSLTVGLNFSL
ncbi:MAG TPA: SusC/RagA family TonB-linked outer membrane protein [Puia sp.]|nr:SusC/RagA family TonB-linked outer membrane protein [Puia sp.]